MDNQYIGSEHESANPTDRPVEAHPHHAHNPANKIHFSPGSFSQSIKKKSFLGSRNSAIFLFVILIVAVMGLTYVWQHQKVDHLNKIVTELNTKVSNLTHQIAEAQSSVSSVSPVGSPAIGNTFYSCLAAGGTLSSTGPDSCNLNGVSYSFPKTFSNSFVTGFSQAPPGAQTLISKLAQSNFNNCLGLTVNGIYPQAAIDVVTSNFVDVGVRDCSGGYSEYFEVKNNIWIDAGGTQNPLNCSVVQQFGITKQSVLATNPSINGLNSCENSNKTTSPLPS
jgi:hypothetical protein